MAEVGRELVEKIGRPSRVPYQNILWIWKGVTINFIYYILHNAVKTIKIEKNCSFFQVYCIDYIEVQNECEVWQSIIFLYKLKLSMNKNFFWIKYDKASQNWEEYH